MFSYTNDKTKQNLSMCTGAENKWGEGRESGGSKSDSASNYQGL